MSTYGIFLPFSYPTFFLCSGLIWKIIFMNVPLNFKKTSLFFGIYAFKYYPGTSRVTSFPPSYASIRCVVNKSSSGTVVDATYYPFFKYIFFSLPFAQVFPLEITCILSFNRFMDISACLHYASLSSSRFVGVTTRFSGIDPSYIYLKYFTIAAIAISPYNMIAFFVCIWVYTTFTTACMYACVFLLLFILYYFIIP